MLEILEIKKHLLAGEKEKCDRTSLLSFANDLLQLTYSNSQDELVTKIDSKLKEFST